MRLFVSAWSLRDTIQKNRITLPLLPAFVQKQGFQSLEVSDRQLSRMPTPELKQFSETAHRIDCDLIIDIGCDLTLSDSDRTSRSDSVVLVTTFVATLILELEFAILLGVGLSLVLYLKRTAHPRI